MVKEKSVIEEIKKTIKLFKDPLGHHLTRLEERIHDEDGKFNTDLRCVVCNVRNSKD